MAFNMAHRGFSGQYPENTMLAFRKAAETGCDWIECDVHLTRDRRVVIVHDEDIARTTDGKGLVRDYTLAELERFDAGAVFGGKYGFHSIPTLEEYLHFAQQSTVSTNIELKNNVYYYGGMEEKVISLVRRYAMEGRVLLSSFNHASVLRCRTLAPEIRTAFLCVAPVGNPGVFAARCGVDGMHPQSLFATQALLKACHDCGILVNVWTVEEPEHMKRLIKLGVNGIITGYPDRLQRVLEEQP